VLKTIRFATSLPLDYLSFTVPHPLPGTMLSQRIKSNEGDFSRAKMRLAILKGQIQFCIEKRSDSPLSLAKKPFEILTDVLFRIMK
jgi:hypothetical protein